MKESDIFTGFQRGRSKKKLKSHCINEESFTVEH